MPATTPLVKVQRTQDFGAEIVLHGDDYDAAYEHALQLAGERGMTFIHPFDDPAVIAIASRLAADGATVTICGTLLHLLQLPLPCVPASKLVTAWRRLWALSSTTPSRPSSRSGRC